MRAAAKAAEEEKDKLSATVEDLRKGIAELRAEMSCLQESATPEQKDVASALLELQRLQEAVQSKDGAIIAETVLHCQYIFAAAEAGTCCTSGEKMASSRKYKHITFACITSSATRRTVLVCYCAASSTPV